MSIGGKMVYYRRAKESDIGEISKLLAQSFKSYCLFYETLGMLFNSDETY